MLSRSTNVRPSMLRVEALAVAGEFEGRPARASESIAMTLVTDRCADAAFADSNRSMASVAGAFCNGITGWPDTPLRVMPTRAVSCGSVTRYDVNSVGMPY